MNNSVCLCNSYRFDHFSGVGFCKVDVCSMENFARVWMRLCTLLAGSSFLLVRRRLCRVHVGQWLGKLQVEGELRSLFLRLVMLTTSLEWRGTAGLRCVVWLWTQLSILMEEVTTSTLGMLVLSGVMLLLARRLVSLLPGELVVLGVKLLPLLLKLTRLLKKEIVRDLLNYKFSNFVSLMVYVQLLAIILSTRNIYLIKICSILLFLNHLVISFYLVRTRNVLVWFPSFCGPFPIHIFSYINLVFFASIEMQFFYP